MRGGCSRRCPRGRNGVLGRVEEARCPRRFQLSRRPAYGRDVESEQWGVGMGGRIDPEPCGVRRDSRVFAWPFVAVELKLLTQWADHVASIVQPEGVTVLR